MSDKYKFFMTKPKKSVNWTTFFDVFNFEFWLVVLIGSCGMAIFFYTGTYIKNVNNSEISLLLFIVVYILNK